MSDTNTINNPAEERETRNSVFSSTPQHHNHGSQQIPYPQQYSQGSSHSNHLEIEIPVAAVPLPTRGLVYDKLPLMNAEELEIKAMTPTEEDILLNRTYIRNGTVITKLIQSCLIDKRIDVSEMLSGDRNALMLAVRAHGYGTDYTPTIECPKCETKQEFPVSLQGLNIKELDLEKLDQVAPNTNLFRFVLPQTNKTVLFKFLTGKDEERILKDEEASKKKLGAIKDNKVSTRLSNTIVSIDGIEDRAAIVRFCQNMPAKDSLALRKHIDNNEPSVDMNHSFTCQNPDCGHQEVVAFPLDASFFWPDRT